MKVLDMARAYLMDDNEIDFYGVLRYLESIGIIPTESEADAIYNMVSDILMEIDLVRSLKLKYDMRKINRLLYGI